MSMFSNIGVTQQGIELLAKVHAGQAELKFTKIVMGSGEIPPGKFPRDMTELVTPILDLNITRLQRHEKTATVWGTMSTNDVREDFLFREKGLYAADPDHADGEILYMYGNAGDMAPHIPSGSGGVVELNVGFAIYVGEAEVTAVLASGIYAREVDLQAHIEDEDKHGGGAVADALDAHITDPTPHVSAEDREKWDNPPSGVPAEHSHTIAQVTDLQKTLDGKAPTSHANSATTYGRATASLYGHAMASSATPLANGTANVGADSGKFTREGHIHPAQTTVTGNAGSATKLATARTINGVAFDGTANITITATPTTHTQSADTISAGTFTGAVVAQTNTNYSTRQVRNIIQSTEAPSGGANGDVWIQYV